MNNLKAFGLCLLLSLGCLAALACR